ncbi:IPExxxVDY family protein [Pseudotenacibaculum haliotis]|uniref:IPExxxVDY family protein n=1 Tax=Pseudotenacibaculum haliotis TaxID=1862138 RepID=A0ABW5LQF2_9FLAO
MQIHSLGLEDFNEDNYTLIGIHTALEDFKLAYLLNNNLNTHFSRANFSLDFEKNESKASFSIYNYTNEKYDYEWYLISNSYKEERVNEQDTLALSTETITYLIPEKKRVDYFIKIVGESNHEMIAKTIDKIKTIGQVVTSYTIETDSLKSKEFLIF